MKIKCIFLISCCFLCSFNLFSADFLVENSKNKAEAIKKERQLRMDVPSLWGKPTMNEQPQLISNKNEGRIVRASPAQLEDINNPQKISNHVQLGDYDWVFMLLFSVFALVFYFVWKKKSK